MNRLETGHNLSLAARWNRPAERHQHLRKATFLSTGCASPSDHLTDGHHTLVMTASIGQRMEQFCGRRGRREVILFIVGDRERVAGFAGPSACRDA